MLNPPTDVSSYVSFLINFMQVIYGKPLTEEQYVRAKAIAMDVCQNSEETTLQSLVEAWKADPVLADFAQCIEKAALSGPDGPPIS